MYAVIMAGGAGTRFWPKSTEAKPKQFLALFGEKTMLQSTVDRVKPLIPLERILVVTNERYVDLVSDQLPDLPSDNIIGEPIGRNTAPCVAAAATLIDRRDEKTAMAVLPADHLIENEKAFLNVLKQGAKKALQSDSLITIGIQPQHAETGYGYIEFEQEEGSSNSEARKVVQFREKPNKPTARNFLDAGNFLWNSGMFIWKSSTILDQFKQHLPKVYKQAETLRTKAGSNSQKEAINTFYHACPSISIDYGIMEKSEVVFVIPASFGWNDVGDWKALYALSKKDERENAVQAEFTAIENSNNNLIHSQSGKIIALSGVDNLAVVETENAMLICNLDEAQGVKQVVNQLRDDKELEEFL